jgi:hypothetical protein
MTKTLKRAYAALHCLYFVTDLDIGFAPQFKVLRNRVLTDEPCGLFKDLLEAIQAVLPGLDAYQRRYALRALTALCRLAGDRPIMATDKPQTAFQLSVNQLNAVKRRLNINVSKRVCPFYFIGGGDPYETQEAARKRACVILLLGLDEPLRPEEIIDEVLAELPDGYEEANWEYIYGTVV